MIDDTAYTDVFCVPPGENLLKVNEDGSIEVSRKEPEERPIKLTGARAFAVEHAPDDMIERVQETTLGIYYRLGRKVTVRGGSGGHWLCLTCTGRDRYELGEHEGCVHIQRVKRWAADHPNTPLQRVIA